MSSRACRESYPDTSTHNTLSDIKTTPIDDYHASMLNCSQYVTKYNGVFISCCKLHFYCKLNKITTAVMLHLSCAIMTQVKSLEYKTTVKLCHNVVPIFLLYYYWKNTFYC